MLTAVAPPSAGLLTAVAPLSAEPLAPVALVPVGLFAMGEALGGMDLVVGEALPP